VRWLPPAARTKLIVLGEGSADRHKIIESLAAAIPSDRLMLAGFRQNVEFWFNAMDVFVHAPRQEAFGLVVAEAMATRLPVVAAAVGGIVDLVVDGESGLLVGHEDALGLAEAMHKLRCYRWMRDRMAARSESVARTALTADLYARRYLDLYHDLLADRQPRGVDEADAGLPEPIPINAGTAHRQGVAPCP